MAWAVIAVAFAAVWVYAVYREDRKNPEPLWLVFFAAVGGMMAVPAAIRLEHLLAPDLTALDGPLSARAAIAFLVAGPVEESLKFLAVAALISFQSHFDEPMDGIVYGAASAAGFALIENLIFMQDHPASVLARGPIGTGAHILFAAFWGGALGHAKQTRGSARRISIVAIGLILAPIAHGLFDLITWSVEREITVGQGRMAQVSLIAGCALFLRWRIGVALRTVGDAPSLEADPAS